MNLGKTIVGIVVVAMGVSANAATQKFTEEARRRCLVEDAAAELPRRTFSGLLECEVKRQV